MSLNKIIVQGNLTKDVEIRATNSGSAVGSFCIAVQRDFMDKQSGQKETDFIDVTVFGKTAEFAEKYFKKGSQAIVEGSLQIQTWTDKNGNNRRTPQIIANNIYFCGSKQNNTQATNYNGAPGTAQQPQQPQQYQQNQNFQQPPYGQQPSGYNYQGLYGQGQQSAPGNFAVLDDSDNLPF